LEKLISVENFRWFVALFFRFGDAVERVGFGNLGLGITLVVAFSLGLP
jgi:hypothetical protein